MKHLINFPKLAALILGMLLSFGSFSAQALQPIVLKIPKNWDAHFDIGALNDWRQAVEDGRASDEELTLSFYQLLASTEFIDIDGHPLFYGSLNAHEARIMLKALRMALEYVESSFTFSFSIYGQLYTRQSSLFNAILCAHRERVTGAGTVGDLKNCGEGRIKINLDLGKLDATQSLVVFLRLGKFLESFASVEYVKPFLSAYTRTPDGAYCSDFINKYLLSDRSFSKEDRDLYLGLLGRKGSL